jgi:hypothetical protein
MEALAIRSIKVKYRKFSNKKALDFSNKYLLFITKKYPNGINNNTYFVLPGFEKFTRNQPVFKYDFENNRWELTTNDNFNFKTKKSK